LDGCFAGHIFPRRPINAIKSLELILTSDKSNVSGVYEERGYNSPFQVAQEAIGFSTARFHAVQSAGRLLTEVSPSRLFTQWKTYALPLPSGLLR